MEELLETLIWTSLVTTVVLMGLTAFLLSWSVRRQRRRNRFGKDDRITAPLHWLYTPGEAPRLHRRLLAAVSSARRAARVIDARRITPSGVADLAGELEAQAGVVDDGLILASRLTFVRRHELLNYLRPQVREIEGVAERLVRMAADWEQRGRPPVDVARLHQRLDAIEQGNREIAELEAALRG